MADFTTIANLRGPAGRDGSNVLPTDEAMAQTAADPQSEFATQLSARFVAVVIYSNGAYPARPVGARSAKYIGPVVPTDWLPNDEWVDNS